MIKKLADLWAVNDPLPDTEVDLVVGVAHGCTKDRLTHGASSVSRLLDISLALEHLRNSKVIYGAFAGSPNPEVERSWKGRVLPDSSIFIGNVLSTTEECRRTKEYTGSWTPKIIVVITDQAHSRRCKLIWQTFFTESKIHIFSVPIREVVDTESPMKSYHSMGSILWHQAWPIIIQWPVAKIFGVWGLIKLEGFHQPTVKHV